MNNIGSEQSFTTWHSIFPIGWSWKSMWGRGQFPFSMKTKSSTSPEYNRWQSLTQVELSCQLLRTLMQCVFQHGVRYEGFSLSQCHHTGTQRLRFLFFHYKHKHIHKYILTPSRLSAFSFLPLSLQSSSIISSTCFHFFLLDLSGCRFFQTILNMFGCIKVHLVWAILCRSPRTASEISYSRWVTKIEQAVNMQLG